ncbi:unnamed protein product [Schistocephalus solidus]|uniref:DUF5523 domain-containing protein n=1 Tax=Schistocephalus solidus TaxID=70667 RepID=A0A3P7CR25_SCHSO|nr:unnamed protein product [Schistocephalus solidus]
MFLLRLSDLQQDMEEHREAMLVLILLNWQTLKQQAEITEEEEVNFFVRQIWPTDFEEVKPSDKEDITYVREQAEPSVTVPLEVKTQGRSVRYAEDEGLYVGQLPFVAPANIRRLENRLLREAEYPSGVQETQKQLDTHDDITQWFTEDGRLKMATSPLRDVLFRPFQSMNFLSDVHQEFNYVFLPPLSDQEMRSLEQSYSRVNNPIQRTFQLPFRRSNGVGTTPLDFQQIEIELASVSFSFHPLFLAEHVFAHNLRMLVKALEDMVGRDHINACIQRIVALKRAIKQLEEKAAQKANQEHVEDECGFSAQIREYQSEIEENIDTAADEFAWKKEIAELTEEARKKHELRRKRLMTEYEAALAGYQATLREEAAGGKEKRDSVKKPEPPAEFDAVSARKTIVSELETYRRRPGESKISVGTEEEKGNEFFYIYEKHGCVIKRIAEVHLAKATLLSLNRCPSSSASHPSVSLSFCVLNPSPVSAGLCAGLSPHRVLAGLEFVLESLEGSGEALVRLVPNGSVTLGVKWRLPEAYGNLTGDATCGMERGDRRDRASGLGSEAQTDPNDPSYIKMLKSAQGPMNADERRDLGDDFNAQTRAIGLSYFRLDPHLQQFRFCSDEELDLSKRFRLLQLRSSGHRDFQELVVPLNSREVPKLEPVKEKIMKLKTKGLEQHFAERNRYLREIGNEVLKRFEASIKKKTLSDIVAEEEIPSLTALWPLLTEFMRRRRPLNPNRKEMKKTSIQTIKETGVVLVVTIGDAKNLPVRVIEQTSRTTGRPTELCPMLHFVPAENTDIYPTIHIRTWKGCERSRCKSRPPSHLISLDSVGSSILINVFDEVTNVVEDGRRPQQAFGSGEDSTNATDSVAAASKTVLHRSERRWLGGLQVPFSVVYSSGKVAPVAVSGRAGYPLSAGLFAIRTVDTYRRAVDDEREIICR